MKKFRNYLPSVNLSLTCWFSDAERLHFFKIDVLKDIAILKNKLLFTEHLRWLLLDFWGSKYFFSAESDIYCWQSHGFLFRISLKTWVKPWKQPLGLLCKKNILRKLANFTEKYLCWSLFLTQAFRPATLF